MCRIGSAFVLSMVLPLLALAQAGTLDLSFGHGGAVRYDFQADLSPSDFAIQSDGKILIVGSIFNSHGDLFLLRLQPDGNKDLTFGKNGMLVYRLPNAYPFGASMQIDGKRRIVIAGQGEGREFLQIDAFVLRLMQNGAVDGSFGSNGLFIRENAEFRDLKIMRDGRLMLVGRQYTDRSVQADLLFMALDSSGGIAKSFNHGSLVFVRAKGLTTGETIIVDSQNRFLISGETRQPGYNGRDTGALLMIRTDEVGRLDKSFGINGGLQLNLSDYSEETAGQVLTPDGKLCTLDSLGILLKQESNGAIDRSFGKSGRLYLFHEPEVIVSAEGGDVLSDRDGGILLILRKYIEFPGSGIDERVFVLRVKADGRFDSEFNSGKERLMSFGLRQAAPVSAIITRSNKLLILSRSDTVGESVVAIARLNLD